MGKSQAFAGCPAQNAGDRGHSACHNGAESARQEEEYLRKGNDIQPVIQVIPQLIGLDERM